MSAPYLRTATRSPRLKSHESRLLDLRHIEDSQDPGPGHALLHVMMTIDMTVGGMIDTPAMTDIE